MTTIQASPAHSHAVSSAAVDGEGGAEQPGHNYDPDQSKRLECGSGRRLLITWRSRIIVDGEQTLLLYICSSSYAH